MKKKFTEYEKLIKFSLWNRVYRSNTEVSDYFLKFSQMTHESADKNVVKMMGHRICIIGIVLAALES